MIFAQALLSALKGIFNYSGRSDRLEHWTFSFITAVLALLVFALVRAGIALTPGLLWACVLIGSWFLLAHVALWVRRLHDHGQSGFWLLIPGLALNIMLVGWLGSEGYLPVGASLFAQYGWWVVLGGRILLSLSFLGIMLPAFVRQGDEGENAYGDPVE